MDPRREGNASSPCDVDPQFWHACAGGTVHLPPVGARVYYFPRGHLEHACSSGAPSDHQLLLPPPVADNCAVLCRVVSVKYLADADSDEVFAKVGLRPEAAAHAHRDGRQPLEQSPESVSLPPPQPASEKPRFFAKTLTQSDANNGGGFSVPRYCADTVFPPLDYSADPPVQSVEAKDVHGNSWKFRHIYRGTPRRHLLTTGWSNFVNHKRLVAGDSIIFLRSSSSGNNDLFVGVRRSKRALSALSFTWPKRQHAGSAAQAAAMAASAGLPFEVVFYPQSSISIFFVEADIVESALQQNWAPGMRFKMPLETEDSSRTSWFMGTISTVHKADPVYWPKFPWKMLEVTWDEPELLQGISRVSPWQIELVSPMHTPPYSLPRKKMRVSQPLDFRLDAHATMGPSMGLVASPWQLRSVEHFPASMQGARHDSVFGLSSQQELPVYLRPDKVEQPLSVEDLFQSLDRPVRAISRPKVSTQLKINSSPQQECFISPNCFTGSNLFNVGLARNERTSVGDGAGIKDASTTKTDGVGINASTTKTVPFTLFGKAIYPSQSWPPQTDGDGVDSGGIATKTQKLFPGRGNEPEREASRKLSGDGTLELFKWENGAAESGKFLEDAVPHCKLFREDEEVGRTIDLLRLSSYQELCERLVMMFGVNELDIMNHLVYINSNNIVKRVGEEPYREFANQAKRLEISTLDTFKGELRDNVTLPQALTSSHGSMQSAISLQYGI